MVQIDPKSNGVPLQHNSSAQGILPINCSKLGKGLDRCWNNTSSQIIDFITQITPWKLVYHLHWKNALNFAFCVFSHTFHTVFILLLWELLQLTCFVSLSSHYKFQEALNLQLCNLAYISIVIDSLFLLVIKTVTITDFFSLLCPLECF